MIRFIVLIFIAFLLPTDVQAQAMQTFQQLPFWDGSSSASYIESLYKLAISLAAVLVVLRLIWAGVQYMLSELVTSKQKAKETIQSALLGLLIILGAVTILNTINPRLTNLDVIGNGPTVTVSGTSDTGFRENLKIGDSKTNEAIKLSCASDFFGIVDQECYNAQLDYYSRSCASNGGQLVERYLTRWALTGSTLWQCEARS